MTNGGLVELTEIHELLMESELRPDANSGAVVHPYFLDSLPVESAIPHHGSIFLSVAHAVVTAPTAMHIIDDREKRGHIGEHAEHHVPCGYWSRVEE